MKFAAVTIYPEQAKRIHSLVRAECCNFNDGNCSILDNGEPHKCPQMNSSTHVCEWLSDAVLPLNPELQKEIFKSKEIVKCKCKMCGKSFTPNSNSAKFCQKCVLSARRKTQAEYARKKRMISRQIEAKHNVYG
jgi:hypothetical protein